MVIDVLNMYNYQIMNNESLFVGMIHSFAPTLLSTRYNGIKLRLKRKGAGNSISRAYIVEE